MLTLEASIAPIAGIKLIWKPKKIKLRELQKIRYLCISECLHLCLSVFILLA